MPDQTELDTGSIGGADRHRWRMALHSSRLPRQQGLVLRVVPGRRFVPLPGLPARCRAGQLLSVPTWRDPRDPLRRRAARPGEVRHLRSRRHHRCDRRYPARLTDLWPVEGRPTRRCCSARRLHRRGTRPCVHGADRRCDGHVSVLDAVCACPRARSPPSGPGDRHRVVERDRADPFREGCCRSVAGAGTNVRATARIPRLRGLCP